MAKLNKKDKDKEIEGLKKVFSILLLAK